MKKTFLTAEWRKLIIANYAIDPQLLVRHLPPHTELDLWNGTCYVSLIGFMFQNTRIKGIQVPFHVNFEEVNLRFYVKYLDNGLYKRGVVFIKEIVPKPAITLIANVLYGEHYATRPMQHTLEQQENELKVEYRWQEKSWYHLRVLTSATSHPIAEGSEAEFITEHYWGYTKRNGYKTSAYQVEHPRWEVYPVKEYAISADFQALYGPEFVVLNTASPLSVFLAEGSPIVIKEGDYLKS
ncbi:DUF2071 domain-containing protein [Rufibacter immobilis]|uniref:DUF2071 domain-containing protein n=1 Tax=Rufibacter immobilis TaxID=1348778 RepID=A0A3M9MX96_9BACT|nr:DUF2071 domain-containing protein [Rufibacter immobilis]RNI30146.1 DUF2071 domain-containing protein [Rufibacter immobilis]